MSGETVTMLISRAAASSRAQLESVALAECSLLRTQLPATFRARSSIALTAEFLRWRDHVDVSHTAVPASTDEALFFMLILASQDRVVGEAWFNRERLPACHAQQPLCTMR